ACWSQWLSFFGFAPSARRPVQVRRDCLALESLEDRLVPSATANGVISGHALQDQTGNGLSADDPGLAHVQIRLYQDTNHNGKLDRRDALVDTERTAANGSYSFNHLKAGTYFVAEETPDGYVRTAPAS